MCDVAETCTGSAAACPADAFVPASSLVSLTFSFTGAVQTWVVPAGVTSVTVDARGASGLTTIAGTGGRGGRVQATLAVTPGQTLNLYVGGAGTGCNTGGWNGGGVTSCVYAGSTYQGAGGGATDIRVAGTALANRVLVAGGGGSGAYNYASGMSGGDSGGLVGTGGLGGGGGSPPGGGGGT